ncbi:sporulation protein YqfD [Scatolibacter rhodanostii]|uniref:sporulation protein YqfD n=1 Tax=Scatolibacter rhodanostii TaxID=2014781 RepID=UPI000C071F46|nr:sporulation protein YqfD [Scatolibacter rhodanostii]
MVSKIFHWLTGYACFEIEGQTARFLNVAVKSNLQMWNIRRKNEKSVGYIRANQYKKLRAISKRCSTKLRCRYKRGLPFYTYRFSRRKGLFLGTVMGIVLYFFLSGFIWNVEVNGLESLTQAQVREAAKQIGVYEGASQKNFNAAAAAVEMKVKIPEISWVSFNTDGCTVQIEIKEAEEKPEMELGDTPSNIIAEKEGVIVHIEAQTGMKKVDIGDVVEKGQLLITGIYSENLSPYIQKKAPVKSYVLKARGSVIAETVRNYEVEVPRIKEIEVETGEKTNSYLLFFGIKIPLGFLTTVEDNTRVYEEVNMLHLLGKEIPIGIRKENYVFVEKEQKELTEEEMKKAALYQLRARQKRELDESAKIMEESFEYEMTETGCRLKTICRLQEEIGIQEEVLWNITDSDGVFYQ